MIDIIEKFVNEYIQCEYEANVASVNRKLGIEEFRKIQDVVERYAGAFMRIPIYEKILLFTSTNEELEKMMNDFYPRILFQIRHYKNAIIGKELKEIHGKFDDLFVCDLSNNHINSHPKHMYSDRLYIMYNEEGVEVIYNEIYLPRSQHWQPPMDEDSLKVLDCGELVEVHNYQAPDGDITCLTEYENPA